MDWSKPSKLKLLKSFSMEERAYIKSGWSLVERLKELFSVDVRRARGYIDPWTEERELEHPI